MIPVGFVNADEPHLNKRQLWFKRYNQACKMWHCVIQSEKYAAPHSNEIECMGFLHYLFIWK